MSPPASWPNIKNKNIEEKELSNYSKSTTLNELLKDPSLHITTISVYLKWTKLKLIHFETLKKIFVILKQTPVHR